MKEAEDNPPSNKLQAGITDTQLVEATSRSGYPLQLRIARELVPTFSIVEEWGYIDRDTKEPRSLDIHAYRSLVIDPTSIFHPELILLVECKRSDLPFVFFATAVQRPPLAYPRLGGFRRTTYDLYKAGTKSYQEVTPTAFLRLQDFPFVSQGPAVSRSFAQAKRSGKKEVELSDLEEEQTGRAVRLSGEVPYRTVILPLASALEHWAAVRKVGGDQARYYPSLAFMVCVLDAPMVVVTGGADKPELMMQPWVRVARQESFHERERVSYRQYVVDCVHVDYLRTFIDAHLLPFSLDVAKRIEEAKPFLSTGRGLVDNWENWKWTDMRAVVLS